MPQTTPERAARWPGMDGQAMDYLEGQGYTLNKDYSWKLPGPHHEVSEKEKDAIIYLIEEWDFDGILTLKTECRHPNRRQPDKYNDNLFICDDCNSTFEVRCFQKETMSIWNKFTGVINRVFHSDTI